MLNWTDSDSDAGNIVEPVNKTFSAAIKFNFTEQIEDLNSTTTKYWQNIGKDTECGLPAKSGNFMTVRPDLNFEIFIHFKTTYITNRKHENAVLWLFSNFMKTFATAALFYKL